MTLYASSQHEHSRAVRSSVIRYASFRAIFQMSNVESLRYTAAAVV